MKVYKSLAAEAPLVIIGVEKWLKRSSCSENAKHVGALFKAEKSGVAQPGLVLNPYTGMVGIKDPDR
ncbi:hypothetical protein GCM10007863_32230 [Dyella mobilis]|uniref:Uncharacterized protein n=1 Tax=Dyella mobilis TaxID=1849582 RepID=A0ABS2KK11_9GAMM|nr:hypothetical protein [Dyella mobilis]GLQ98803.1 hypothetical protein GCM10007863_32230 [Dyella mobilis]